MMTDIDTIELIIGGQHYTGWHRWRVERDLESTAGSFEISVSQPLEQAFPPQIAPGAAVVLKLGADTLITGYIDSREFSLESRSLSMTLTGRDKTADLIDCSAVHKSGQFRQVSLTALATEIAAPFGISVVSNLSGNTAIPRINIEKGETAFELLERAARSQNVLLTSNGLGNLVLQQAESWPSGGELSLRDAMRISRHDDVRERFSHYIINGQDPSMSLDDDDDEPAARMHASETTIDPEMLRYRPLIMLSEEHHSDRQKRAIWEMRVRRGRGLRWTLVLPGYRNSKGALWAPGHLLSIDNDQQHWLPSELLISKAVWQLGDTGGATTELELTLPDAYLPEPVTP